MCVKLGEATIYKDAHAFGTFPTVTMSSPLQFSSWPGEGEGEALWKLLHHIAICVTISGSRTGILICSGKTVVIFNLPQSYPWLYPGKHLNAGCCSFGNQQMSPESRHWTRSTSQTFTTQTHWGTEWMTTMKRSHEKKLPQSKPAKSQVHVCK